MRKKGSTERKKKFSNTVRVLKKSGLVADRLVFASQLRKTGLFLEESERDLVRSAAVAGSSDAIREAKALNLKVQYIENGKLLEKDANGVVVEVMPIKRVESKHNLDTLTTLWHTAKD